MSHYLKAKTNSSICEYELFDNNWSVKLSSNRNRLFLLNPLLMNAINNSQSIISKISFNASDDLAEEKIEIERLINFKYSLKKPIIVNIKREKFEYIGDIPELEIYSFGKDKFEVLREINEEVTELFEELIQLPKNKLGKYPKKWKKILEKYIHKNEDKRFLRK